MQESPPSLYKMDVFRFPIIEWHYRWQRPQQLSVQFARDGHRVFYFSLETIPLNHAIATYEQVAKRVEIRPLSTRIWSVKICSNRPLNAYRDTADRYLDRKYMLWSIQFVKEKFGIDHTLSIVDLPFWSSIVFKMDHNKVVYDCMDEHSGFSNVSPELLALEPALIRKADLVVASSTALYNKVARTSKAARLIRNAGEYTRFSIPPERLAEQFRSVKRPVIGYFGTIADWFDMDLVVDLAYRNPGWTFMLVGHNYLPSAASYPGNLRFIGEKPYAELPQYLHGFDVCIIPFRINELTKATNPVKIYEYMAAGKPVVASKLPELELLRDHVWLAENTEGFEQAIRKALEDRSKEAIASRKKFAASNTWEVRYRQLMKAMCETIYPRVSVVIAAYNNWTYTKKCLDSVLHYSRYPNLEVIVVDNHSTDGTKQRLAEMSNPTLKVIRSEQNLGYSAANTLGCSKATGSYYVLLNNDTVVPPCWVHRLIEPMQKHADIGMAGPMSNSVGNDQKLDFFAGGPKDGADQRWLRDFYDNFKGKLRYTDMLGFFCVAIKKKVYKQIGSLDHGYSVGMFEDDDYCKRVKQHGYKMAIVEDAFVYHHGSASFKQLADDQYQLIFQTNKEYYERKWGESWQRPKPPISLFAGAADAYSVSSILQQQRKRTILMLGNQDWPAPNSALMQLARVLSESGGLVIALADRYCSKAVEGIHRVGPSIYMTNHLALFKRTTFDLVVYCGFTRFQPDIESKAIYVEASAYSDAQRDRLMRRLKSGNADPSKYAISYF